MKSPTFTRRPALFVFVWFGSGIVAERMLFDVFSLRNPTTSLAMEVGMLVGISVLLASIYSIVLTRTWMIARLPLLAVSIASTAFLLAGSLDSRLIREPLAHLSRLKPEEVHVFGRIASDSVTEKTTTIVACDSFVIEQTHIRSTERIAVEFPFRSPRDSTTLRAGELVELTGTLEPLTEARNPYEYPADEHAFSRYAVTSRLMIKNKYDVVDKGASKSDILRAFDRFCANGRSVAARAIAASITDSLARGFVEAVVLGERSDLPASTRSDFTDAGVAHILAVSGFNVAIIALLIAQLLRLIGLRQRRVKLILTMLTVFGYSAIVGFEPSVVRALIMIEIYLLSRLLERKADPLNVIASAGLVTLLIRPFDLFDGGFQLSYAAVLGLAVIYPELRRLWKLQEMTAKRVGIRRPLAEAFAVSLAATIATLPVTIWHFHRISIVGSFVNLPIIPLASVITSLGFLLIPIQSLSQTLGQIYGDGVTALSNVLLGLTHLSANLPRASVAVERPSLIVLLVSIVLLLYVVRSGDLKHLAARGSFAISILAFTLFLVPFSSPIVRNESQLTLMAYDVGQGDCFMLESPEGHSYFIDLGGISLSNVTRAERAVIPTLEGEGIHAIDAAFLTHMHRDHYGGASILASRPGISTYYWSGERVTDPLAFALDRTIIREHSHVVRISAGDRIQLEPDLIVYALHPPGVLVDRLGPARGARLNNGSLVLKVVYKNASALFLGDIEAVDEAMLVRNYGALLHSDVVKVAHHGSAGSVLNEFVHAVSPRYAIISVGENNRYGHPAAYALNVWGHSGAKILRTDRQGAIMLRSDGEHFRIVDWRL